MGYLMHPKHKLIIAAVAAAAAVAVNIAIAQAPPKANKEVQKFLDASKSLGGKPIETLTPDEARKQPTPADAVKKVMEKEGKSTTLDASVAVKHMTVPGPLGDMRIHIYTPSGAGFFPIMVYFHSGGFVIADTKTYDASPRALGKGANAIRVSVDYHLAPEHKFPAAPNDTYAGYPWVLQHAKHFNGDPSRVAVGSESAGGDLAAVESMMARDKKTTLPMHQLLIYPVTNSDMDNAFYKTNTEANPLNKAMMKWFFKHDATLQDGNNPYAIPMKAETLKELPSATVITDEIDPLRTEGKEYANHLKKDGVPVAYKDFKGVAHEFFGMGTVVLEAKKAEDFV